MQSVVELLGAWGIWLVIVNVLADQSGLPLPSYPTLVLATALGHNAGLDVPHVLAAAVIAALVADAGWYVAGSYGGRAVLCRLCRIARVPDACVRTTESAFLRFGLPSLLVTKFVPGFSALSAALAGSMRVAAVRYFTVDLIGAVLWAGSAVLVGLVFRDVVSEAVTLIATCGRYGVALVLAGTAAVGLLLGYRRWRRRVPR